jgi:hypothetical protein
MPVISRFRGIVVYMNYHDHNPPHCHVRYREQEAIVEIESGVVVGVLSRPALRMLREWVDHHREELMTNWRRARAGEPLQSITPLT